MESPFTPIQKMKVESINHLETVGPQRIAFNLDEELSHEVLGQLRYGNLSFSGRGKVLVVSIPDKEPFNTENVATLNGYLADAVAEVKFQYEERMRMLLSISIVSGVPLDVSEA